ncbi:major facilitator superfamily domain-containing protein [Mycena floridula]|nr:major facilitator superfamily domain-containing protein [Mycena floridula]
MSTAESTKPCQMDSEPPKESSATLKEGPGLALIQTKQQLRAERIQFATICGSIIVAGWNDASYGPLLPRIQQVYGIGYTTVSLLFVSATIGFLSGAVLNIPFSNMFTFGQLMVFGSFLQCTAYAIEASAPPFGVLCLGYGINGIGMAIQDGQANGYLSTMQRKPAKKMSLFHATYGAGALLAPLSATRFAQTTRWSFHYLVSLAFALVSTVLLAIVLRFRSTDDCLAVVGQSTTHKQTETQESSFRQIFRLKSVHLLSIYILLYVGLEATLGGWIVTYVMQTRGGGPSSGYISTGYFGGLMLGRALLLPINAMIGERRVLFLYFVIAIGFELMIWFASSVIADAVAAALLGFFLGPWYPLGMNQTARVIPQWLLPGSMGWIAGFGQAGSALLPFIVGTVSQKVGIESFPPLVIGTLVLTLAVWAVVLKS